MKATNFIKAASLLMVLSLSSCQKSLEEKAAEDAREYTRKYCPTPVINCMRTDSITFDIRRQTYTYHCTFADALDNAEVIDANRKKISELLLSSVKESTIMKPYVQAGFHFEYICRSEKDSDLILLHAKF